MVSANFESGSQDGYLLLAPNRSMSWRESMIFFVGTAMIGLGIALVFAFKGLWLILPFAGLELAGLGAALYVVARAGMRREVVRLEPEHVRIESGRLRRSAGSAPEMEHEFPRVWTRLELRESERLLRRECSRLMIGAHGRWVEIGGFLSEPERLELAAQLRRRLARNLVA